MSVALSLGEWGIIATIVGVLIASVGTGVTLAFLIAGRVTRSVDAVHRRIDAHMASEERSLADLYDKVNDVRSDVAYIAGQLGLDMAKHPS